MSWFEKLVNLKTSLCLLIKGFPNTETDVEGLFTSIGSMIAQKVFTLQSIEGAISQAEQAVSSFMTEWDGSQAQWDTFVSNLKALFA